jgi:Uma2 family endonuclease
MIGDCSLKEVDMIATTTERMTAQEMVREAYRLGGKVYSGMNWTAYRSFMDELGECRLYFTYDGERLEIMPHSWTHEFNRWYIGRLLEIWAEETETEFMPGGEMTIENKDVERAIPGDECYWVKNADKIGGKEPNFTVDPPPDLLIESEKSRAVLSRISVIAALGIPEVWRFDGKDLKVGLLQKNGEYKWGKKSKAFPTLPMDEFADQVRAAFGKSRLTALKEFRAWAREKLGK